MARVSILAVFASLAAANMMDVIEPSKLAPEECSNGCATWDGTDSLWNAGVPEGASNHCAQPGKIVNHRELGSWCFCNNNTGASYFDGNSSVPLPNMTFNFENMGQGPNDKAYGEWVAFTEENVLLYAASEKAQGNAVPWKLLPTEDFDGTTFYIQNLWKCPSERRCGQWMQFSGTQVELASKDDKVNKVPWKVVPVNGTTDTFHLQNLWKGASEPRYGMFLGPSGSGEANEQMTLVAKDDVKNRGTYKFVPTAAPEPTPVNWSYCTSAQGVPEQINIQIASSDSVVVSWVTFEASKPVDPPTVTVGKSEAALSTGVGASVIKGVTHTHTTAGGRLYYMHFVRLAGLDPRSVYHYNVRSGGVGAAASEGFSFRAPYAEGVTKIDIFGDMGIYEWNNMEWLYKDCATGDAADLIVHMGDHAYNEGDEDEKRADAYMAGYQPTLARCPWFPIVGNHEFYATELSRYLNSTWQGWGPIDGGNVTITAAAAAAAPSAPSARPAATPATPAGSALGTLLSVGNHHSAGSLGAHPSGSSRYFSVDFGLVHLIALDFNLYYGEDPCGAPCKAAQLKWLEADLALANAKRAAVPWVMAMAHFPVFCTGCAGNGVSAAYYASDAAETYGNCNATASRIFDEASAGASAGDGDGASAGVGASSKAGAQGASDDLVRDIAPLLEKYGVDLFLAGHWHYYESLYPARKGSATCLACAQPLATNFDNPTGTIHITTGNAGPPSKDTFKEHCPGEDCGKIAATRKQSLDYGYGRFVVHNDTVLEFTQFANADQSVVDHFVVVQPKHGPFVN